MPYEAYARCVSALVIRQCLTSGRSQKMKDNEYNAAEIVEIGPAQSVILGVKTIVPDLDSAGMEPFEREYIK